MPINFHWQVQDRVLLIEHIGQLTVDEMDAALTRYIGYLDSAQRPFHLIADWRRSLGYPLQFSMVSKSMSILRHWNMGHIALVGVNPSVSFWLDFFSRLTRVNYRVFKTLDEAIRFLDEIDRPQAVSG